MRFPLLYWTESSITKYLAGKNPCCKQCTSNNTQSDKLLSSMFKNKQMDLRQVKCSQLYWADALKIVERPTCYYKWKSEYYYMYATFDWELINAIPYESTTETYLQSLQFILSHNFAECDSVVEFWKFLKRWFISTFQFAINFTYLDILLGIPNYDNGNDVMILNFVILFAKYYIYNCKQLTFSVFW